MSDSRLETLLFLPECRWSEAICDKLDQHGFRPVLMAPEEPSIRLLLRQHTPALVILDLSLYPGGALDIVHAISDLLPAAKTVVVVGAREGAPLDILQTGVVSSIDRQCPLTQWPVLLTHILEGGTILDPQSFERLVNQHRRQRNRDSVLEIGALRLNCTRRIVTFCDQRIHLTPRETALLICLMRHADQVVTFDELLNQAWEYGEGDGTSEQVRLYVARLRRKLDSVVHLAGFIVTERSVGYRLQSHTLQLIGHVAPLPMHAVNGMSMLRGLTMWLLPQRQLAPAASQQAGHPLRRLSWGSAGSVSPDRCPEEAAYSTHHHLTATLTHELHVVEERLTHMTEWLHMLYDGCAPSLSKFAPLVASML